MVYKLRSLQMMKIVNLKILIQTQIVLKLEVKMARRTVMLLMSKVKTIPNQNLAKPKKKAMSPNLVLMKCA